MKRTSRWLAVLSAVAALAVWGVLGFVHDNGSRAADAPPLEAQSGRDLMQASLVYDAGMRTLRGTQTLLAQNRTDAAMEDIVLRLYMNGENEGSVSVTDVRVCGQSVPFAKDAQDPTVLRIARAWQPGEAITLSWTLMLTHERTEGAAVITLPSLAMAQEGAWRTDAYDPLAGMSYAQAFDVEAQVDGETVCRMRGVRDASFALPCGAKAKRARECGVQITAYGASASQASALLGAAGQALGDLDKLGFPYPFDTLTVVGAQDGWTGDASRSGVIALQAGQEKEALVRQATQLLARQTFGIAVESDPWNAPWLSWSLSSAVEMLCFRQRKGAAAYEERLYSEMEIASRITRPHGVCVGAGTDFFGSHEEMDQVLGDQGGAMLLGIGQAVGEEAFLAALDAYVQQGSGAVGTRAMLEEALLAHTGSDWSGYLEDELAF